ncbi:VOC family protein [Arenibaculum pallidiluteum]|uniref:VOC family protein n=1 Tax=Arenibaculum pallidiluteum TaxID=2812559 RepID=UPI001A95B6B1|nr:VOC family protein [Arenibaculum pallidiluteum]
MAAPIPRIDHTLIGVPDLEAARGAWERLGFAVTPRGRHIGWGTANYCVMFPDDYVELLGIVDPTQFVNRLDLFLERRGAGLMGLAWGIDDAAAVHAALASAGLAEPPRALARLLELPEGDVMPRFELVPLASGATPALSSFCCRHLTPELLRRPEWQEHRNGAVGLEGVTVAVADPDALAAAYSILFGPDALHATPGRLDVRVGPHALRFLTPDRLRRRYPQLVPPAELPAPLVMTVRVTSLEATGAFLAGRGIGQWQGAGHRIVVPPDEATGVVLEFAEG